MGVTPLLLALQTPVPAQGGSAKPSLCLPWAPRGSPSSVRAAQDRLCGGPASLSPASEVCRTDPCPLTLPTTRTVPAGPTQQQGALGEGARGVPALQPGSGVLSALLTCAVRMVRIWPLGPSLGLTQTTPGPPGLTFRPIHLFTGFMRKEERKPLMYITKGMVAMYFCKRRGQGEDELRTISTGPLLT